MLAKRYYWLLMRKLMPIVLFPLLLAACGSGTGAGARHPGVAQVAYAGSLQLLNEKVIGPAYTRSTGFGYQGRAGGSLGLAGEIGAGEISPNVFESVGATPIERLYPKKATWYVQFAASPLVLAYNPKSRFAPELASIASGKAPLPRLFALLSSPGFLLGRTNPATDPQGQAFWEMVELAAARYHLGRSAPSRILGAPVDSSQVFQETALEARLEAGQLDAASAFLSQAVQLKLPYIALPAAIDFGSPALVASYARATLTLPGGQVVHGAPLTIDITEVGKGSPAAAAYIKYVLSPAGRRAFAKAGYSLLQPEVFGTGVPAWVRAAIDRAR